MPMPPRGGGGGGNFIPPSFQPPSPQMNPQNAPPGNIPLPMPNSMTRGGYLPNPTFQSSPSGMMSPPGGFPPQPQRSGAAGPPLMMPGGPPFGVPQQQPNLNYHGRGVPPPGGYPPPAQPTFQTSPQSMGLQPNISTRPMQRRPQDLPNSLNSSGQYGLMNTSGGGTPPLNNSFHSPNSSPDGQQKRISPQQQHGNLNSSMNVQNSGMEGGSLTPPGGSLTGSFNPHHHSSTASPPPSRSSPQRNALHSDSTPAANPLSDPTTLVMFLAERHLVKRGTFAELSKEYSLVQQRKANHEGEEEEVNDVVDEEGSNEATEVKKGGEKRKEDNNNNNTNGNKKKKKKVDSEEDENDVEGPPNVKRTPPPHSLEDDLDVSQLPCRIAIDSTMLLAKLLKVAQESDPLWFLTSAYPPVLKTILANEMEQFRKNNMVPVVVFNGMAVHGDVESFVNTEEEMKDRDEIWEILEKGEAPSKEAIARAFDISIGEDAEMMLMRYLIYDLRVEAFRAPFLQWGQMSAFLTNENRYCDEVYASIEQLMFDHVKRVILNFDFTNNTFTYINKAEVLQKLFPGKPEQDASDCFLDLCLITVSHPSLQLLRPALPITGINDAYRVIQDTLTAGEQICDMVMQKAQSIAKHGKADEGKKQAWKFMKGRAFVRHSQVLIAEKAELVPLSKLLNPPRKVPKNLITVLGSRLPILLYYFQFIGMFSVGTMTPVTQNYLRDENPVSDSVQCRGVMETIISLRTQVLYQLLQFLQENDDYRKRVKMSWIRWYQPISVQVRRPPDIRLAHWNLSDLEDTTLPVHLTLKQSIAYAHRGTTQGGTHYRNIHQMLTAIHLKSLDLLGYFTHAHVVSDSTEPEASDMSCYAEVIANVRKEEFTSLCVLLVELLRTHSLSLTKIVWITGQNFHTVPAPTSLDLNDAVVPLATRIACLFHIPCNDQPWPTTFDRDILSFQVMVRNLHRTLRSMMEAIAVSMFLDGSSALPPEMYCQIPRLLPFDEPPSTVAAQLLQYVLISEDDFGLGEKTCGTPEARLNHLCNTFSTVVSLPTALFDLFEFWEDVYTVISDLHMKDEFTVKNDLRNVATMAIGLVRHKRSLLYPNSPPNLVDPPTYMDGTPLALNLSNHATTTAEGEQIVGDGVDVSEGASPVNGIAVNSTP